MRERRSYLVKKGTYLGRWILYRRVAPPTCLLALGRFGTHAAAIEAVDRDAKGAWFC